MRFATLVPVTAGAPRGARVRQRGNIVTACVPTTGSSPVRKATLGLSFPEVPGIVPSEPFAVPEMPQAVQLLAMRAVKRCSP